MSELRKLADAKIEAERQKLLAALPGEIEALKRKNGAQGLLRSGNTIIGVVGICTSALDSLGVVVLAQYRWAVSQSLFATQSWVEELVRASHDQLQPLAARCVDHVTREANLAGGPNAISECVAKLEMKREEIATDVALGLRATFAERKRGLVRGAGKAATGLVSKLFGGPKP